MIACLNIMSVFVSVSHLLLMVIMHHTQAPVLSNDMFTAAVDLCCVRLQLIASTSNQEKTKNIPLNIKFLLGRFLQLGM